MDAQRVAARVANGLLSVTLPKKAAETHLVPVSSSPLPAAPAGDAAEGNKPVQQPDVATATLVLPGLGASDVSVSIENSFASAPLAHIKGTSPLTGSVHEVLRLPARAILKEAAASLVNGVLTFSCPVAPVDTAAVAVVDAPPAGDELKTLFEAPVPGTGAADLKAHVTGRALTISRNTHPKSKVNVPLPQGTAPASVVVVVKDGLLRVLLPSKAAQRSTPVAVAGP